MRAWRPDAFAVRNEYVDEGCEAIASSDASSALPKPTAKNTTPSCCLAEDATLTAAASVPTVALPSVRSIATFMAPARAPEETSWLRASMSASAMLVSGPWSPRGTRTADLLLESGEIS